MDAIGEVISGSIILFTKTEIGVKGVSLPTESITIALIICSESSKALFVSQKYTYGEEVTVSLYTPFMENATSPTDMLSVALTIIGIVPFTVNPAGGLTIVPIGGVIS